MASKPTQRSLAKLRAAGMVVNVVEHWQAFARRRIDLFNVIDIVALDIENGRTLGIQTTSGSSVSARVQKIFDTPEAKCWIACGNRLVVHGWAKRGPKGKRKVWTCREVEIVLDGSALVARDSQIPQF